MSRTALLVGIDRYDNLPPLDCCVADVKAMEALLKRHEDLSKNYETVTVTSDETTINESELRRRIRDVFARSRGMDLLFYFSGHGVISETGGYLVTQDFQPHDQGFPMAELLQMANQSGLKSALLILDCCHSGGIGSTGSGMQLNQVTLGEGVTVLAASSAEQQAQQGLEYSLFTELLLDALSGGAADLRGNVSAASMYAYVEQALGPLQQRPMYQSHARSLSPVRRCEPRVPDQVLLQLTELFRAPTLPLQLDPSYEHSEAAAIPENVARFNLLKQLRDGGLLRVQDGKDLYYAALESGSVELTTLGQFYWRLVKTERI